MAVRVCSQYETATAKIAMRIVDTLKHDNIHGLKHRQHGVRRNPLSVVKEAGADFAGSIVDVWVKYASETPHLKTAVRPQNTRQQLTN